MTQIDRTDLEDPRATDALKDAAEARERAYAPYSRFKMGAAVVTSTNAVVPGSLVENVSLGLAMCAERAALFGVVAQGEGRPEVLALVSPRTSGEFTWPCGACLQVALELGGPNLLVVVSDGSKHPQQARLRDLASRLPFKGAR
jgi:cytidine deaminase